MKKLKFLLLFIAVFTLLTFSLNKVSAEEDTSSSDTTTEDIVVEENEETNLEEIVEENKPSDLQIWVNENLGWLVGIPTGTLMTALIEFLVLVKKSKKKDEEVNETKKQNSNGKEILTTAKNLLTDTKELAVKLEDTVAKALTNIEITDSKVNERVSDVITKVTNCLETLNTTLALLENRVSNLEAVQEMIALHTKELVANGTAEEITKKIRG